LSDSSVKLSKKLDLAITSGEHATAKAKNTGVSPLRRARSRATSVEMTD
jgi:hypothetical protein